MRWMSASETFSFTASLIASTRSSVRTDPSTSVARPDSIGPPETNTVGMLRRSAASSMPGVILSQFEMHTSASAQCTLHHVLDRVGDGVARGQRVEHAVVTHRDAVVDRDRVELARDAARLGDRVGHDAAHGCEVRVAGNELGERVRDGDDRLAPDGCAVDAGGAHQCARTCHIAAVGDCARAG